MIDIPKLQPEVTPFVPYGPRTKAAAAYLLRYTCPNRGAGAGQLLPYEHTVETRQDLFRVCPSEAMLAGAQATTYTALEPVEQAVKAALRRSEVVPAGETSQRVAGKLLPAPPAGGGSTPSACCWTSPAGVCMTLGHPI